MTKEEILAMKMGRKLDKAVHEQIMGLCWHDWVAKQTDAEITPVICKKCGMEQTYGQGLIHHPYYSTDISAAWQVVEKMCNWDVHDNMLILKGQCPNLQSKDAEDNGWWEAEINGDWGKVVVEGKTAPEAICKASLLAKLEKL